VKHPWYDESGLFGFFGGACRFATAADIMLIANAIASTVLMVANIPVLHSPVIRLSFGRTANSSQGADGCRENRARESFIPALERLTKT
jgi:hypothetical protein